VTAGVIGTRKFSYDVWGDPVNLASRLEGQSSPGRILICPGCHAKLGEDFVYEARGPIEIKGIGAQEAWYLVGERNETSDMDGGDAPPTPSDLPRTRTAS
jgi:adenylate cyclase